MPNEANNEDVFFGSEATRTSVLLKCPCEESGADWMEGKEGAGGSGLPTNHLMVLTYECKHCNHRVKVHFVVEAPQCDKVAPL
jgi:hypothetical protein